MYLTANYFIKNFAIVFLDVCVFVKIFFEYSRFLPRVVSELFLTPVISGLFMKDLRLDPDFSKDKNPFILCQVKVRLIYKAHLKTKVLSNRKSKSHKTTQ